MRNFPKLKCSSIPVEGDNLEALDLLIYTVGFETRSRYIVEKIADKQNFCAAALVYEGIKNSSFEKNLALFRKRGHSEFGCKREDIDNGIDIAINCARKKTEKNGICIAVDISALDRRVMSLILLALCQRLKLEDTLRVLYTPAKYNNLKTNFPPMKSFGPVIPELMGRILPNNQNKCLVMGVGYEYGASLSVIERIEPKLAYFFSPVGFDERYQKDVRDANFDFDFDIEKKNTNINSYNLRTPASTYNEVDYLVQSISHRYSVIFVPFGPKIFSAICILIAFSKAPYATLLRYSLNDPSKQNDVESSGHIIGFDMKLR